jgi:hypothetical protein
MIKVYILGSSDVGSAAAIRLFRSGFHPILVEKKSPLDIHYSRTFSSCAFSGKKTILGVSAKSISGAIEDGDIAEDIQIKKYINFQSKNKTIPYIFFDELKNTSNLPGKYVICTSAFYNNLELPLENEPIFLGLNSNASPTQYHYIISNGVVRYPFLTDSFKENKPRAETEPHIVKTPLKGIFVAAKHNGDLVYEKDEIGKVNGISILAPANGSVNGILNSGYYIEKNTIICEICLSNDLDYNAIPEKYFNLAGGFLEAIMYDAALDRAPDTPFPKSV